MILSSSVEKSCAVRLKSREHDVRPKTRSQAEILQTPPTLRPSVELLLDRSVGGLGRDDLRKVWERTGKHEESVGASR